MDFVFSTIPFPLLTNYSGQQDTTDNKNTFYSALITHHPSPTTHVTRAIKHRNRQHTINILLVQQELEINQISALTYIAYPFNSFKP